MSSYLRDTRLVSPYSIFFLISMMTAAKMAYKPAMANKAAYAMCGALVVLYRSPLIMPMIKALNPITNAKIHRIQAIIVARALNICGIFTPPVTRIIEVCTGMVLMSIGDNRRRNEKPFCALSPRDTLVKS